MLPRLRERIDPVLGGAAAFPLVILFLLFFFDEFDTAAFGVLAPDIERSFHLSDTRFGLIVILNVSIVLLLAVPIGWLGDRIKRTWLVVAGGVLAGVFSFLTGVVGVVGLLFVVRIGNGLGRLINEPVHSSLLADYYPPDARGPVYAIHRTAPQWGLAVGAAVAGAVAALFGWQAAFMILIVPILVTVVFALRLREPRRGATDDPDAAAEADEEEPVPFRQAARTLWAVPTLRRQFWSYLFIGAGVIPLAYLVPLFYKRAFGLGPFPRGLIFAAGGLANLAGLLVAGRRTRAWFEAGVGEPLRRAGGVIALVGVGLVASAVAPTLWLALPVTFATYFVAGFYYPPFLATQALVSPARVRTLSFGLGAVFLVLGVWVLFFIPGVAAVSDDHGIRWGLGVLAPYWIIGGAVLASASKYVAKDSAAALRSLAATVEARRQRLTAATRSLLVCAGVDVAYEAVQVLFGVDLDIQEGELVALLGTNGAGKSTLLKAVSGLVEPTGGAILFDGTDITHADPRTRLDLGIVQMPGGRSIFPTLSVDECLRLAGWAHKDDPRHVKEATGRALERFPVLEKRRSTMAGDLSGGEQQMLGLAMALISKPRLLMIDELSLGLAPTIVSQLVEIVRAIHDQGTTVIIVEQSVNVALTLAQRAVFMEKGEVRFSGPAAELLDRPDVLRSVFLEGAAAALGVDAANGNSNGTRGKRRAGSKKADTTPQRPDLLVLDEATVRFGGVTAVDHVSLRIAEGEIVGFIGPNGAGKTTLFDVISGFMRPDHGRVSFADQDVTTWSADHRARAGMGRSFQDARIFPSMTVAENIAVALERHLEVRDPISAALALPASIESETEAAWEVHELIELLGLDAFRNKFVGELSTGTRRIVDLAMAIAHRPRLLLLDEPSSGIAQREAEALGPLLQRIQRELDCGLLLIEHDMPLVTSVAPRLVALELGAVIADGAPADVVNHPQVVASYLGTDEAIIERSGATGATGGRRRKR
jgi:ABC-type branched-subunit amino acid transport system ATPase component/predicted MFS family arabinose efflux permease